MDAKGAALVARKYFEETKTSKYFLFEAPNVTRQDGRWVVDCEVKDLFDEKLKRFKIIIDDGEGVILDVEKID